MKIFEYKIVPIDKDKYLKPLHQEINAYGDEGWELVAVTDFSKAGFSQFLLEASLTSGFVLFFKREKQI